MGSGRWNVLIGTAIVILVVGAITVLPSFLPADDERTANRTEADRSDEGGDSSGSTSAVPAKKDAARPPSSTTTTAPARPPANTLQMQKFTTITGSISPKSVVASGKGVVTAQNMMYTHTMTAYDKDGNLVATVPDTVTLSDFGIDKPGQYRGAPVEAAFTHDGKHVYVSNYAMYGAGLPRRLGLVLACVQRAFELPLPDQHRRTGRSIRSRRSEPRRSTWRSPRTTSVS